MSKYKWLRFGKIVFRVCRLVADSWDLVWSGIVFSLAATGEAGLQQAKDISRQTTTLRRASLPHPLSILPPPTP